MKLSPQQLERVAHSLTELEGIAGATGITISDDYGYSYLKIDDEMIRFTYNDATGQYLLVPGTND